MARVTEAIYTNGIILKPTEDLALREAQRVRLIVEPLDDAEHEDRSAALERLLAGIEGMRFFSRGRLPARDALHDRP